MSCPMATHGPRPAASGFLDLHTSAQWFGVHRFVERSLFELCGTWSTDHDAAPGDPEGAGRAAEYFAVQSANHGWRLAGWVDRSPASVAPEEGPADTDWRAGIEAARSCSDPLSRLAVHTHVLAPWLAGSYGTHEGLLGSAADGGVLRWLRICREDVLDAVTRGGVVIDAVLAGRGDPPVDGYDTGGSAAAVGRVLAALMGD